MTKKEMEAEYKRLLGIKKIQSGYNKAGSKMTITLSWPFKTSDGTKAYTVVTTNGPRRWICSVCKWYHTLLLAQIDSTEFKKILLAFETTNELERIT